MATRVSRSADHAFVCWLSVSVNSIVSSGRLSQMRSVHLMLAAVFGDSLLPLLVDLSGSWGSVALVTGAWAGIHSLVNATAARRWHQQSSIQIEPVALWRMIPWWAHAAAPDAYRQTARPNDRRAVRRGCICRAGPGHTQRKVHVIDCDDGHHSRHRGAGDLSGRAARVLAQQRTGSSVVDDNRVADLLIRCAQPRPDSHRYCRSETTFVDVR